MDLTPGTGAPADSPTAPVDSSSVLASLTPEEYRTWEKDGSLPTPDAPADSSPAPSGEQSASTDATAAQAASEPAAPADTKPKKNAKTRHAEIDAEVEELHKKLELRRALREELAALDRQPSREEKTPDSPPARDDGRDPADPRPTSDQFEDYEAYLDARDAWNDRRRDRLAAKRDAQHRALTQRQAHVQQFEQIADAAVARVRAYEEKHPGFQASVDPTLLDAKTVMQLRPNERVQPINVLVEQIVKSEYTAELFEYFSSPEGKARRAEMERMAPTELLRAFGRIEARFESRAESGATPVPKTVTSAPEPPVTVGRKPAQQADDVEGAWKAGDFTRYERLATARDLAARR